VNAANVVRKVYREFRVSADPKENVVNAAYPVLRVRVVRKVRPVYPVSAVLRESAVPKVCQDLAENVVRQGFKVLRERVVRQESADVWVL
jgi:hypothetical protein